MKPLSKFIAEQLEHQQFINEHFVNVFKKEDMKKYGDEVWKMLQDAYKYCGGVAGASSIDDIIEDTDMWKMVRRNGKITAVKIYKFKNGGRKANCAATDGTEQGIADMKKVYQEDGLLKDRKAYAEVSGKALSTCLNQGNIPLPAVVAKEILKKDLTPCEDGWFYTRKLGDGHEHHKLLVGNPPGVDKQEEPSPELIKQLKELARKYHEEDEKNKEK